MNEDATVIEDGNIAVSEELKEFGNFTMMPNSILCNPDLSSHEVRLWGLLYSYFYGDNKIYPGMARLAKEMNCSDDTVLRARKKLEAKGLLSVVRHGYKKTNTYTIHLPKKTETNSDTASVRCVHAAPVRDKENKENNTEKEKKEKMEQKERKEKPDCGYAASSLLKTKDSVTITEKKQDTTKYALRKYLEKGAWPIMSCQTRKDRACGDNYGDAECPFCDYVFKSEGEIFEIGERCRKCNAIVTSADT